MFDAADDARGGAGRLRGMVAASRDGPGAGPDSPAARPHGAPAVVVAPPMGPLRAAEPPAPGARAAHAHAPHGASVGPPPDDAAAGTSGRGGSALGRGSVGAPGGGGIGAFGSPSFGRPLSGGSCDAAPPSPSSSAPSHARPRARDGGGGAAKASPGRPARQGGSGLGGAMQADDEAATVAYHDVLFSPDLAPKLLSSLDRATKVALRCVNKAMRSQVDASIKVVASPASGFSPDALSAALVRWSGMRDLTLFAVNGTDDLAPLATASLAGLTSLTVRQRPAPQDPGADVTPALDMPEFSSSVVATLRVIDVSDCHALRSIDFVRSCEQLSCLWMAGCVGVSNISPLAACSETLEELWMAFNWKINSLAPLKACSRLRKLDLRECSFARAEVGDLRLTCTQLADPASVQLEGWVHDLRPNMPAVVQASALTIVADAVRQGGLEGQTYIAAAGAIPALVQQLLGSSEVAQEAAARALHNLAKGHAQNQAAVIAAGGIPALVKLLGAAGFSAGVQAAAAGALGSLAADRAQNQADITAADVIPALTRLQGPEFPVHVQAAAADALRSLLAQ
ncbi:hypothetical protein FOA52_006393 [Chlamydomonas sp. UWO 241]|nr:hypothetical protein FOA52_006393 [Chlamydomonas sp. UWO 241]